MSQTGVYSHYKDERNKYDFNKELCHFGAAKNEYKRSQTEFGIAQTRRRRPEHYLLCVNYKTQTRSASQNWNNEYSGALSFDLPPNPTSSMIQWTSTTSAPTSRPKRTAAAAVPPVA